MSDSTSAVPATSSGSPFVGREREMAVLDTALRQALGERGGVVLVGGDAGIGKTRLVQELLRAANESGAQTGWGNNYSWEGTPAYRPWVEILRGLFDALSDNDLQEFLGTSAAEIARIVPQVREQLPDLPVLPEISPVEGRFRLFDAIAAVLRNAARAVPLVLVLDDLHWADRDSLRLLQFVARDLSDKRILILGTYREVEAPPGSLLAEVLADLARVRGFQQLDLPGLDGEATGQLAAAAARGSPSAAVLDYIRDETAGNPLFISEISRLLASEGRLHDLPSGERLPVPNSVLEVIGSRLERLSPECQELLGIASVIGRRFSLPSLEAVTCEASIALLDLLDEASRTNLIRQLGTTSAFQFAHPLVESILYQRLPTTQRLTLHRRVGDALEVIEPDNIEDLAYHFYQAVPIGTQWKAIDYAIRSGDRAMEQAAWESAAIHYQQAAETYEQLEDPDPAQLCEIYLALGDARNKAAPAGMIPPEARDAFRRAAEIARETGSAEQLARAAHGFTGQWLAIMTQGFEQHELIEEALEALGDTENELRVYLLGHYALNLRHLFQTPTEHVIEIANEGVELSRRIGSVDAETFALLVRVFARRHPRYIDERQADFERMSRIIPEGFDPYFAGYVRAGYCTMPFERGDFAQARRMLSQFRVYCDRYRFETWIVYLEELEIVLALVEGEFLEAQRLLAEREERTSQGIPFLDQFIALSRERGRPSDAFPTLEDAIAQLDGRYTEPGFEEIMIFYRIFQTLLLLDTHQDDAGRRIFDALASDGIQDLEMDSDWLLGMTLLAEASVLLADRKRASELYAALRPYSNRVAASAFSLTCAGAVPHYLGLLATLLERWDEAEEHFERALEMNEDMGARPFTAWTEFAYADMLARQGRAGDRERATALFKQSLATADELGMVRLQKRAEPLADRLQPDKGSRGDDLHGLTPRQIEVLRLVAEGLSDREIGGQLHISHHTVMRHVANIFNTLGVNSRTAAVAYALRHELL